MPDFTRKNIPKDSPYQAVISFTDQKRAEKEAESIFNFGNTPLEKGDVKVTSPKSKGAAKVEPSGFLGDEKFGAFTDQAKQSDKLGYNPMSKTNYVKESELESERPFQAHQSRSRDAIEQDLDRKAPVTTDPTLYAENPGKFDYPYLDTPPEFKEEYPVASTSIQELDRKAGDDEILNW